MMIMTIMETEITMEMTIIHQIVDAIIDMAIVDIIDRATNPNSKM